MSAELSRADFPHMRPSGFTWRREEGQTMAEYAVVVGVITPVVVLALVTLGDSVSPILNAVAALL
jgi:Flp pilus assembly pilin Flp